MDRCSRDFGEVVSECTTTLLTCRNSVYQSCIQIFCVEDGLLTDRQDMKKFNWLHKKLHNLQGLLLDIDPGFMPRLIKWGVRNLLKKRNSVFAPRYFSEMFFSNRCGNKFMLWPSLLPPPCH